MQVAVTETFAADFPDIYQRIHTMWESIRGEHTKGDELSLVSIVLREVSAFDKYQGTDLLSRFRENCLEQRGNFEVIADKRLPVADLTSDILIAQSAEGYFFYFGVVQISTEYCYTFSGDCNIKDREFYEPLFDGIWQSLEYFGNPAKELAKQKAAIDALFRKNEPAKKEEKEKKPLPFSVPANGKELWELNGYQFHFLPDTSLYVSDNDGALYIKLEGEMQDYNNEKHGHLLNDYNEGKVYLQFYFKGVYNNGVPTGIYKFKDERDDTYRSYLWKGGFQYSFNFNGEVTLRDGWLNINGYFGNYLLKVVKKLSLEDIQWDKYRFTSLEELDTAPVDIVHHIQLTDPYPALLHEKLHPFTQVRTFAIHFSPDNRSAADLKEFPKPLKRYKFLKQLNLSGISAVDTLPQWIGDLKELEHLSVSESQIEGIHPYVFQLPKLKFCYLGNNRLQSLAPSLPDTLEFLLLENNQLTSLPASLAELKNLKSLNISRNPLQKLPAGLENIESLDLELEKKLTLLDYSYKGADGKGTVPYDNTLFFAHNDKELLQGLETAISDQNLQSYQKGLIQLARKSVAIATAGEDHYEQKGNSRFGGLPDLPAGTSYPSFTSYDGSSKGLQFISQLNCADVAHLQDYLPRTGILYFFIRDQDDFEPLVMYYDGDMSLLQSASELDITEDHIFDDRGIYTPYKATFDKYPGIPFFYNIGNYLKDSFPELEALEDMYDETEALKEALYPSVKPVHSINSYVFKQHDTPETEAVNAFKGKPEDWMVLLRVGSDSNTGFSFWDAGEIYFVIHKSDLAQKNFSKVFCGLESS
ncbi:MAG TPA: DUF1963 domain-containing protein [Chitinophaga sp.]|nr:DUF1963 domain-containing protein [Chitinophaga sp.]